MRILQERNGFTLIETLVAITVLLIAIAGPLTIASRGLSSALFARDQITASYLAQEAVEYVRNVRDENVLKNQSWLTGLDTCLSGGTCSVDIPNDVIATCSGGVCPVVKFNSSTGLYNHSSGENSKFTRSVQLVSINADEIAVTVNIAWRTGGISRTFDIRENLLNWQ